MKRRIIFRHLQNNRYDSMDDMFEDIDIDISKYKEEEEIEKENGCFAGFLGFFRFFTNLTK